MRAVPALPPGLERPLTRAVDVVFIAISTIRTDEVIDVASCLPTLDIIITVPIYGNATSNCNIGRLSNTRSRLEAVVLTSISL